MFGLDASEALIARARSVVDELVAEMRGGCVVVIDSELRYLAVGGPLLLQVGYRADVMEGRLAPDVIPHEDWAMYEPLVRCALAGRAVMTILDSVSRDDTLVTVGAEPLRDDDGTIVAAVVVVGDQLPRVDGSLRIARLEEPSETDDAFEQAPVGMAVVNLDGTIARVNAALAEYTAYAPAELIGRPIADLAHPDDAAVDLAAARALIEGGAQRYELDTRIRNAHGHAIWVTACASVVRDPAGTPRHAIVTLTDCSERKLAEERLRRHAERDPLTLVHNRRRFERDLDAQLQRCRRFGERAAVLVIDVDGLKRVNDEHGHATGDALLRAVAAALRRRTRQVDSVARLGGDEFGMLLTHVEAEQADAVAAQVADLVAQASVTLPGGGCLHAGASVGVAMLDDACHGVHDALDAADRAMYERKRSAGL